MVPEELYSKIKNLSDTVRKDLRCKGLVIPVKHEDGSITIGGYTIKKNADGLYSITDFTKSVIVNNINLPQTAILVANRKALGYYRDADLLSVDQKYGYADFEERLYKRAMTRKSSDAFPLYITKYEDAKHKKIAFKRTIDKSFEKLLKLV